MNNNKKHWIYSFDKDKNISFAIASILNGYYEHNYPVDAHNIQAIQSVHNLNKSEAKQVINKAKDYIKGESHEQKEKSKSA
jgi:hypothetical protein|tara:strand:- start:422 stop:664 length:243 start_codon:yes stop_codon:yes gene_type:complete